MLDDCLTPDLNLVFCGTAASSVSAARGHYYAGPGNKFWKTLHEIGLTPRQLAPAEYPLLPSFGIGLTDIVKGQSGMDSQIDFRGSDKEAVERKILHFQPQVLCFNGKRAAEVFLGKKSPEYGLLNECIGKTKMFVAPSTSGSANGFWDIGKWHRLAQLLTELGFQRINAASPSWPRKTIWPPSS